MNPHARVHTIVCVLGMVATALIGGCDTAEPATTGVHGPQIQIAVAPLELTNVTDASYTIAVTNFLGEPVWAETGLTSVEFGDGGGALSYVGPCDAQSSPNTVTLTLDSLSNDGTLIDPSTWRIPPPVARVIPCTANTDTLVEFNLVVLRNADQGFFDIALNFSDVFCSAKLDCENDTGGRLELLFDETGERNTTVVLGFACTAGATGVDTHLHLNDARITCDQGTFTVNPSAGVGNLGASPPLLFQTAAYTGAEQLPGLDKCFWNMAFGVDLTQGLTNCTLTTQGTVSAGPLGDNGETPTATTYPIIDWAVPIIDDAGALSCAQHPVNVTGSNVATKYVESAAFQHHLDCDTETTTTTGALTISCGASGFTQIGVSVSASTGDLTSPEYQFPSADYALLDCCADPCCGEQQ